MAKRRKKLSVSDRQLDARPDSIDFRDQMFVPTLVEVPSEMGLDAYRDMYGPDGVPILDQGQEGACTGFGLAAVANYLLRTRTVVPDTKPVSARMLYEMARRYDEWPGEDYAGSSARGAMKGWHKHGVCTEKHWPYRARSRVGRLTASRAEDARERPLGAYFRVNHKSIVAMHTALAEVRILYATAIVHTGWDSIRADGRIPFNDSRTGGHAFAIVAFDRSGFWIQNSWGDGWGVDGFALITYDDWLAHGTDVWAARLGAPVDVTSSAGTASLNAADGSRSASYTYQDIRPHVISIGNDGRLQETGTYGTSAADVRSLLEDDFATVTKKWKKKRVLIYAHGGLTDERSAIQKVADLRETLLDSEVYPFAFIWRTDYWTTLNNILSDALNRRRSEGFLDATMDFMLDRVDDALEPLARQLSGKAQWQEMKENAILATKSARGGARIFCDLLADVAKKDRHVELHVVGFSAGSVFMGPLTQYLTSRRKVTAGPLKGKTGLGRKVATCTLWAPACTIDLFNQTYMPAIQAKDVERFAMFTLTDTAERDDNVANFYNKSLLYLVSNAFEHKARVPLLRDGVPILGMQKFVEKDRNVKKLFRQRSANWILAPNTAHVGSQRSEASHHGDFDDDLLTLRATLARVLGKSSSQAAMQVNRTPGWNRKRRRKLVQADES